MKYFPRTLLSTLLAVGTAASLVLSPLAAVIGSDLYAYDSDIHKGTVLSHGVYWGATANDKRTENYISYTPSADVTPIVTYGSKVTSTSTVSSAAKALEAQGYRVVAGINGDYYYTGSGHPHGAAGDRRCDPFRLQLHLGRGLYGGRHSYHGRPQTVHQDELHPYCNRTRSFRQQRGKRR